MRKIISMLLSLLMICSMLSAMTPTASAVVSANLAEAGNCGDNNGKLSDNLRYTVSGDYKTLTITGSGRMHDFTTDAFAGLDPNSPPWWQYADTIEEIIIGSGVEYIGSNAFRGFSNLVQLFIPGNVKSIGDYAAAYCEKLHSLVLDEGVETVGNHAFRGNRDLFCMWLPLSLKSVGERAFAECNIHDVYTCGDQRGYEQPFTTYWFETDGTLFDENGYIHRIFYPSTVTLWTGYVENGWSSDDNCHWKSDCMFWKVRYQVGEHTYGDEITYRWDGDMCTALQICSVCGREVILEQKKGGYVSDINDFYDGVKGHYEATFYYPEYSVQSSPACSVVIDRGGHKAVYPEEGYYEFIPGSNYLYCMTTRGDGESKGDITRIVAENEAKVKVFKLERDKKTNAYIIRAANNDLVLDVGTAAPPPSSDAPNWGINSSSLPQVDNQGAPVQMWEDTGLESQRWLFMDAGGGYVSICNLRGEWMQAKGGNYYDPIQTALFTGEAGQKWQLIKVDYDGQADTSLRPVSYDLTDGVLTISGDGMFTAMRLQNNLDIHKIVVEDGITAIGVRTFSGCSNLKEVTIKQNCTICADAFSGLYSLVIHAPSTCISDYTDTYGAGSITLDITCGNNVKATYQNGELTVSGSGDIWDNAFDGRSGISSVVLKKGVTGIGARAFAGTGVSSVEIPGSVKSIGTEAFDGCYMLSSVDLGDIEPKSIGDRAFNRCQSLSQITIPASVKSIGSRAFAKSGLSKIIFRGDCSIGEYAFENCYITINVPTGWTQGTDPQKVWYGEYEAVYEGPGCDESEAVNQAAGEVVSCDVAGHKWILTDWPYVCSVCGAVMDDSSGSVLSEGSVWIVIAVAAAAVAGVAALVIVKKKKPAVANSAEKENEE